MTQIKTLFHKQLLSLYHSPTFNTLGSYASQTLYFIIVLPLVLTRLPSEEIVLWYLFSSIIAIQMLADMGFNPTFVRVISYAMGGANSINDVGVEEKKISYLPNWNLILNIVATMRVVYFRLSIFSVIILATFGTWTILKPASLLQNDLNVWVSWIGIIVTTGFAFYGNVYSGYLQGVNQIATLRRWETITSLASLLTSLFVLFLGGTLLALVLSKQFWSIVAVLRNYVLCRNVENKRFLQFKEKKIDKEIFNSVWTSSWRSGIGVMTSHGLVYATGLVFAQIGSTYEVARYLVSLRLIQTINLFCQAPFYSKLPLLARLYSERKKDEQIRIAAQGMKFSYLIFVAGFVVTGIYINQVLEVIGSNVKNIDMLLWILLGIVFFAERYGAMHIQLYSTTNQIIWHIANGIAGIINIAVVIFTFTSLGVYAFPLGMIVGNVGFYSWYAAKHSYREYQLSFFQYESKTSAIAFFVLLLYSVTILVFQF
ncbi:MAG: hypothetical protein FJ218_05115 [Ignavibacteria bacterium]|nr:hypothetical protein [Ignavibacteria bacterium]